MRTGVGALLVAALVSTAVLSGEARAQSPAPADAPVLIYQSPQDGDVYTEPLFVLQLCFQSPINIKDLDKGGDFNFSVTAPDDLGLGLRIVFQPDGYGVAVYPGEAPGETEGEWTFSWRVTHPETLTPAEGEVPYEVDPDGGPIPAETPPSCVDTGGTATPIETVEGGPTRTVSTTGDGETETPGDASETPENGVVEEDDNDGPDIGTLAFITIGAAAIAAVVGIAAYFVRRRVGYEPHAPHEDDAGDGAGEHH